MQIVNGLEPCPFCKDGGTPFLKVYEADDEGMYSGVVECLDCGVAFEERCSSLLETRNALINRWETRYEPTCEVVEWIDDDWGVCECGGDVYEHDVHCSNCGKKVRRS